MPHALVTGASSGIGAAITERLLESGWSVTGISRRPASYPSQAFHNLNVDMNDLPALTAAVTALETVDAVIHAAGFMAAAPLGMLDAELSEQLWRIHVLAPQVLLNTLAPRMPTGGRIVLIGSRTAHGAAGRSQYVACKAAVIGMVRSWAAELAPRGITANIVAPGATLTPMLSQPGRVSSPPKLPPIGRYIDPKEVAALVNFLVSPEAGAITGQEYIICGGASLF
ncbi:oxidoreductase [Mangrovibacter sp. MFB070]|uniref:SDR family NAD(P)-dependent oxidoreductase n=1 Tax=Mangrovibacter sp. MFB070 TaxID=1224318 RepID=UPI0004D3F5B6|nr:SDR family oxidoreductase [Mangrovibacter sp. MFB070]KEA54023.1 oxidoreductase [Mangrovibacter sp. MFB070]